MDDEVCFEAVVEQVASWPAQDAEKVLQSIVFRVGLSRLSKEARLWICD